VGIADLQLYSRRPPDSPQKGRFCKQFANRPSEKRSNLAASRWRWSGQYGSGDGGRLPVQLLHGVGVDVRGDGHRGVA